MRCFRDIGVALGAILLMAVLFELGLRATGAKYESSFFESDPVLYMTLRPGAEGWQAKEGESYVTINSWGMRDVEHSLVPSPGTLRIALLGDSMIAAEQVPLEKTMAKVLEAKLQQQARPPINSVEVLNFAVGGYTLAQEFLLLKTRIWSFHPDIVMLFLSPSSVPSCNRRLYKANVPFLVVVNDQLVLDPASHPPAASSPEARTNHAQFADLMNRIRLFQLVRKATQDGIPRELAKLTGKKPSRNQNILNMWLYPPSSREQENAWQLASRVLEQMAEDSRNHSAEFWLSAIGPEIEENPDQHVRVRFLQSHGVATFDYSENRLQNIASSNGIKFLPLESRMIQYSEHNHVSLRGFFNTQPNYGHWNEIGNAAAAAIVADVLLKECARLNPVVESASTNIPRD